MKAGTTVRIPVHIELTKSVTTVIITLKSGNSIVQKGFASEPEGIFNIDLTQEDTEKLKGNVLIEAQINYSDLSVQKTRITTVYISDTLATNYVPNNAPTDDDAIDLIVIS